LVEAKLALSTALRARRTAQHLSQGALAKRLKSSQSRVAHMEAADRTVSVDLCSAASSRLARHPVTWRKPSSTGAESWLPNDLQISCRRSTHRPYKSMLLCRPSRNAASERSAGPLRTGGCICGLNSGGVGDAIPQAE
jgi:transcriptional regulator with XRE-family HTH domain